MIEFKLPGLPVSYNRSMYWHKGIRRFVLTDEIKKYKKFIKLSLPPWQPLEDRLYKLRVEFHSQWYYKNGKIKRQDIQNLNKALIDALSEAYGIDDSRFWEIVLVKKQSEDECFTVVRIEELEIKK